MSVLATHTLFYVWGRLSSRETATNELKFDMRSKSPQTLIQTVKAAGGWDSELQSQVRRTCLRLGDRGASRTVL